MIFGLETKTQPISKEQVWASWKRIKKGGEGVGVDNVSIAMIEKNPRKYLYPMALGVKSVKKSRMMGNCQVRFCERLGVKLPRSTRQIALSTKPQRVYILQSRMSK